MRRREFINLTAGAAMTWPLVARAQQSRPMRRVGFLRVGPPPPAFIDGFRQGMRERGLIEEQHFVIEYGLTWQMLRDGDGEFKDSYGIFALPESFLIDPDGKLALIHRGTVDEAFLNTAVTPLIEQRAASDAAEAKGGAES